MAQAVLATPKDTEAHSKLSSIPGSAMALNNDGSIGASSGDVLHVASAEAATVCKEGNDVTEQDLSEEEDDYCDTLVRRYKPGVYVEVKLKDVYRDDEGKQKQVPMVIDFFEECLKAYKQEHRFIYEDSYLKASGGHGFFSQELKNSGNSSASQPSSQGGSRATCNSKNWSKAVQGGVKAASDRKGQQELSTQEASLDDVMWLKNRPNDPLLKCIQSITDRLNIQGIVGDPATYLAEGGDDMHYDIDDPFIDDAGMFSELQMSRNDILKKGMIEKDFSVWSEEEEDLGSVMPFPEDFIAEYASLCHLTEVNNDDECQPLVLFFYPGGWKRFAERIPKQFHPMLKDFENIFKNYTGYLSTSDIREIINSLLGAILARLCKIQEPKQKKSSNNDNDQEAIEKYRKQVEIVERHGLDCVGVGKIIGVNGRVMRWIVRTIYEVTNAVSWYELNETWIKLVLEHNQVMIKQMEVALIAKMKPRVEALKEKRSTRYLKRLDEDLKYLAKRISQLRKVVREYEEMFEEPEEKEQEKQGNTQDYLEMDALSQQTPGRGTQQKEGEDTAIEGDSSIPCTPDASVARDYDDILDSEGKHELVEVLLTVDDLCCNPSDECTRSVASDNGDVSRNYTQSSAISHHLEPDEADDGIIDFSSILKKSTLWKRIRDTISIYRFAAFDILTYVQMTNIDLTARIAIGATDFRPIVKESINMTYPFDKAYIRVADIIAGLIEEIFGVKIMIPAYVSRVAVMCLHEASSVDNLLEDENDVKLVLYDNSKLAAPVGKVKVFGAKARKKTFGSSSLAAEPANIAKLTQQILALGPGVQSNKSVRKADAKRDEKPLPGVKSADSKQKAAVDNKKTKDDVKKGKDRRSSPGCSNKRLTEQIKRAPSIQSSQKSQGSAKRQKHSKS